MAVNCFECNKRFGSQSTLNRHLKNVHNGTEVTIFYDFKTYNSKCFECSCSFKQIKELREHLSTVHHLDNEIETLSFENFQEFENWLTGLSAAENIQYVRVRSDKKVKDGISTYYYNCNRSIISGDKRTSKTVNRKRALKSQGCSKLGYLCTSQVKVVERNDHVEVIYYKTHYQHKNEVQHLRINKEERANIADKLIRGVSVNRVLDQNMDFAVGSEVKRKHILTRKDINNIKTSFGIASDEGKRNINDALSIELFVEEQRSSKNNCVLYYESQGECDNLLKNEDCMLSSVEEEQNKQKHFNEEEAVTHMETLTSIENKRTNLMDQIHSKLTEITQKLGTERSEKALNECYEYLKKSSSILNEESKILEIKLPDKKGLPANKRIPNPSSLFSTKKVLKKKKALIKKPNEQEVKRIQDLFRNHPFISIEADHDQMKHISKVKNLP